MATVTTASSVPPEQWLRSLLRGAGHPWPTGADEEFLSQLLTLSYKDRVTGLLCQALLDQPASLEITDAVLDKARGVVRQITANELLWQDEVAAVTAAMAAGGLSFLLFKGTPLAYTLYPQPWLRNRGDTDILFADAASAERAWLVLSSMGYQRMNTSGGELLSCQFPCTRQLVGGASHMLDVHWGTSNHAELRALGFDELLAESVAVPDLGADTRMPCLEHALVLACLHRLAHRHEGEENRLIWLYDIHLLLQGMSDEQWLRFTAIVASKGTGPACREGIERAQQTFGTVIPAERASQIRTMPVAEGDAISSRSLLQRDLAYLGNQASYRATLQLLRQHLLPPVSYMVQKYQPRSRLLLPYLYLKRAVLGVVRRFKLHRADVKTGRYE